MVREDLNQTSTKPWPVQTERLRRETISNMPETELQGNDFQQTFVLHFFWVLLESGLPHLYIAENSRDSFKIKLTKFDSLYTCNQLRISIAEILVRAQVNMPSTIAATVCWTKASVRLGLQSWVPLDVSKHSKLGRSKSVLRPFG